MAVILKIMQDDKEETADKSENIVELAYKEIIIGRSLKCHLAIKDPKCSKAHFSICLKGPRILVKDLGSKNGTYINDVKISHAYLYIEDRIRVGKTNLTLDPKMMTTSERKIYGHPIDFSGSRSMTTLGNYTTWNFLSADKDKDKDKNSKKTEDRPELGNKTIITNEIKLDFLVSQNVPSLKRKNNKDATRKMTGLFDLLNRKNK